MKEMKTKTLVIASLATIIVVTIGLVSAAEYNSSVAIQDEITQENCNGNRLCYGTCERAYNRTENCNGECQGELRGDGVGCTGNGYGICKGNRERVCGLGDGTGYGSKGCCRN